jgi:uncharacterized protein
MSRSRPASVMIVGLVLLAGTASAAWAETSGWNSKVEVPKDAAGDAPKTITPPSVKPAPGGKAGVATPPALPLPAQKSVAPALDPKRIPALSKSPSQAGAPPAPQAGAAKASAMPPLPTSLPPPTGETAAAAYELFDQGRYLSALSTAVKAVRNNGEREAYTLIGRIYEEGLGVGRNEEVASEWYAQGAELGDLNAQFALGLMYAEGRGVAKNLGRAGTAFEAAAKQGHPVAQYNLGMIYAHGDGRDEDFTQAAHWLEKAAAQNHAPAQYDLATLYYEGRGVGVDEAKTAQLLAKAADAGMPAAQLDYARMLAKGEGVAKDDKKAFHYIRLAAEKGNVVAQNRLARFFFFGVVVDSDLVQGAKWHLLARASGAADMALDNLMSKMPADQRKKAEQAASEWAARAMLE